jgi:AcrR family transcriptional regulator
MRVANPELERQIRERTLSLLMEKEPGEIGMRDIAKACGVSATTIYYYFADKDALLEAVKFDCLGAIDAFVRARIEASASGFARIRAGLEAFRDWAFAHRAEALLVMGKFKPNVGAGAEEMARYYRTNDFAKEILDEAVAEGIVKCDDTMLASSLCIAAVWGATEMVLLNRSDPAYWDRGIFFTDGMIDMCLSAIMSGGTVWNVKKT